MEDNMSDDSSQRCPHGFIHEDLCHTCYVANMMAVGDDMDKWAIFRERHGDRKWWVCPPPEDGWTFPKGAKPK